MITSPTSSCLAEPIAPIVPEPAVVEAIGTSLDYRSPRGDIAALRDVTLSVRAGEFVSIVGPSGCGKSSFLKLVAEDLHGCFWG